jgi:hypothetical protein
MGMRGELRLFIIVLASMLAACGRNDIPDGCSNDSWLKPLPPSADFVASGAIIVTAEHQEHKFNFFWQQTKQQYNIGILGPLGIPIAEINSNDEINLVGEDRSYNLKELMLQRLNYYISPAAVQSLLLRPNSSASDIKVLAVSYSCDYKYKLPNKVVLQLLHEDVIVDIRIVNWQL